MPVIIGETFSPSFVTIVNEKTKSPSAVTFIREIADRCRWHGERRLGRGAAVAEIDTKFAALSELRAEQPHRRETRNGPDPPGPSSNDNPTDLSGAYRAAMQPERTPR